MVRQWIKKLVRRQRIARHERREANRYRQDRRHAKHLERAREGIKDNMPQAPPGM